MTQQSSKIYYTCTNCKSSWNHEKNCNCYNSALKNHNNLFEKIKKRLSVEYLDYDVFIQNLTNEEKEQRRKNNELFNKCSYDNSIKNVIVLQKKI